MATVRARRKAGAVGDWLNSCTTSAFDDSFAFTDLDGAVLYSCLDEAPVSLAYRRAPNGLQFKFPAIYKDFDWNWEPVDVGGTLSPVSAWYRNVVVHGLDQRVHLICMYTDTKEAAGELSPRRTGVL